MLNLAKSVIFCVKFKLIFAKDWGFMGFQQNNLYYLRLDMRNPRLLDEAGVLGLVILACFLGYREPRSPGIEPPQGSQTDSDK